MPRNRPRDRGERDDADNRPYWWRVRSTIQALVVGGSVRSFSSRTSPGVTRGGIEPKGGMLFNP